MRRRYKALLMGAIIFIFLVIYVIYPQYIVPIGLLGSIVTIISFLFILTSKEERTIKRLEKIVEEYEKEKHQNINQIKKLSKDVTTIKKNFDIEKGKTRRLSRLLDNVGVVLNRENISKEELIKNITSPLKAIVFFKTWEDPDRKREIFMNKVYPDMHIYGIRSGLSILPPKYIPQHMTKDEMIEWFLGEIEKRIPKGYQYNLPFITVINLTDIRSFRRLASIHSKGHFSYLDKIPIDELAPSQTVLNFLAKKKKISLRNIIEIPNLLFLIDEIYVSTEDKLAINRQNKKIINEIKTYLKTDKFITTDLANIDQKELKFILVTNGIKNPDFISSIIKYNAKIWKQILDRQALLY